VTTPNMTTVDADGMQASQASFQTAIAAATAVYNNMQGQQENLAAAWSGDTAQAFLGMLGTWLDDFQTVNTALQSVETMMAQNTGIYLSTQDANQQAASSIVNDASGLGNVVGLSGLG
jgi:WXG100 family type VII secretion target